MSFLTQLKKAHRLPEVLNSSEKNIFQALCVLLLASAVMVTGQWLWSKSQVIPAQTGEYVEGLVGNPIYVNPLLAQTNDVDTDLSRLIFSSLLKYDKEEKLVPDLLESYSVAEDQTTYSLILKKSVLWQDGQPLTIDDVIFTIKAIQDPQYKSPLYLSLQGVDILRTSDQSLNLILKKPFAPFPSILTFGILPEHIWGSVPPGNFGLAEYNIKPIGSGPWQFKSLVKDKQGSIRAYTLVRNENHHGNKPNLEKVTFKFYPTSQDVLSAAQSKEILGVNFVAKRNIELLPKNFNIESLRLPQYTALFFNETKNQLLKDIQLRKALAHAINKTELVKQALNEDGEVVNSPILPGFLGHKSNLASYDFNPETAKQILNNGGWKEITADEYVQLVKEQRAKDKADKDTAAKAEAAKNKVQGQAETPAQPAPETVTPPGLTPAPTAQPVPAEDIVEVGTQTVFRKKQTDILELTLTTVNGPENQKAAEVLKEFWQNVGIKINIDLVDPAKISREVIKTRNFDILLYGEIIGADPDPFPFWHSSQSEDPGLNLSQFQNKEADRLLVEARLSADTQLRESNYQKFQEILNKELPAIFLYSPSYTYALDRRVRGFDIKKILIPADRFNNLSEWYLRTKRVFKLF